MTAPLLGHLDPEFLGIMDETQALLRRVYQTANAVTFPVSATGMAGMETCLVNLLEPGDAALCCVAGFFAGRMAEVARRAGAKVSTLERPWGDVFPLEELRVALRRERPKLLAIVQAETSTGAWQPLEGLGALCRETGTLLVVDAVTSLGCVPLAVDEWGIDAVYSCSQKGLSCPPGLSPVSFSERALDAVRRRKTPVQSWYFDLTTLARYWGGDRAYHHTAPISMIYALRTGLQLAVDEGLPARWERHLAHHRALKSGLEALGLRYVAKEGHQLPQLNAVLTPDGLDELAVRKRLLEEFRVEIGAGLGALKGKAWRIGLMGTNSRAGVVLQFLAQLEICLAGAGAKISEGTGVAAAARHYA